MPTAEQRAAQRGGSGRLTAGATSLALLAGAWLIHDGAAMPGPPPAPPAAASAQDAAPGSAAANAAPMAASVPTRMRIPSIKVDAPVATVGLDAQGHLAAPAMSNRNLVGWYQGGATPGAVGTAITVGHVDNHQGASVFYQLGRLRPGDAIEVQRGDRHTAVFTVDTVRTYAKSAFPDSVVYGPTGRPELRVLTCGGRFDRRTGYQSNVVVFAHLTATR